MDNTNYEAIKAKVLEEQREARKAKAKERERINNESWHMFDEVISRYLPKLIIQYGERTGNYNCADIWYGKIDGMINATIRILGERDRKTAYMNGKAKEANKVLEQMLEQILKGDKK